MRSELDRVILGVVAKFGPLTSYAVGKHFRDSPASRFSDSAGSIYPAMERLLQGGLLRVREEMKGRQPRRLYKISAAGQRELVAWLTEEPAQDELDPPADPLRLRLYFLAQLPPRERRAFLDTTIERVETRLAEVREYARGERAASLSQLASEGMVYLQRARLQWLRYVRENL